MKKVTAGVWAIGVVMATLTGCGSAASSEPPAPTSSGSPTREVPVSPSGTASGDTKQPTASVNATGPVRLELRAATVNGVNAEIVTVNGWTAYRFEPDSPEPSSSFCVGECLEVWPPVFTDGSAPVITGVDPSQVGHFTRPDGYEQMTLRGWPLYRFKDDKVKSDAKGEGVGQGNWSTLLFDGKPAFKKS